MALLNELRHERGKAVHEARAILEETEARGREMTAYERARFDNWMADEHRLRNETRTTAPSEYSVAFGRYIRSDRKALSAAEHRALSVGTNTAGGYTVPVDFEKTLIEARNEENVVRRYATTITTSGDHNIAVISAHGSASWVAEGAAFTASDEVFGQKTLKAYKAGTLIQVSEELLNDSAFSLESYLAKEFGRRVGRTEEAAFVNGDGAAKPKGFLQDATLGITGASATAITADEVIDTFFALKPQYRPRAVWVMNDATVKAVSKLKDTTNQYLWQPGLQAGTPDTIKGRPVVTSTDMPVIAATARTMAFGDLSYYWIGDRSGVSLQVLRELYAANGQVGFRMFERTDGVLTLAEAVVYYRQL